MINNQFQISIRNDVEFSIEKDQTIHRILGFIKEVIPGFEIDFRKLGKNIQHEDSISEELLNYFLVKAGKNNLLFHFNAKIGADFRIRVSPPKIGEHPIFLIEAKRLPPTSPKSYVTGGTGGISRFKNENEGFGKSLKTCAMLGYIQDKSFDHWENEINLWIDELIIKNESGLNWVSDDKLVKDKTYSQFVSKHIRSSGNSIILYHFWLMLNDSATSI